jgi:cytosine/adenosine deaminase-related metal-dependent hydrolase
MVMSNRILLHGGQVLTMDPHLGDFTQGDVVVLDATALNMAPIHDPVASVILCADVSNVESVLVAGVFRKRDGRLLADVARARDLVQNSRDYLVARVEQRKAAAV